VHVLSAPGKEGSVVMWIRLGYLILIPMTNN